MRELTKNGFHSPTWFINHSPNNVHTYAEFLMSIGLKPSRKVSKKMAIQLIYHMREKLGRNLMFDDFRNPNDYDEIGISAVKRYWGTFNSMMIDLGFEINQENMMGKHKNINELKNDIIKLCDYIFEAEGRKNISFDDINKCEWCLSAQTYSKHFKELLRITLTEYINSIGFIPNKEGAGMNYKFKDSEITKSKFEYDASIYLRSNNIPYQRNIRYNSFTNNYKGNKDCDYVITINGMTWYIEIAGMLDYTKIPKDHDDSIRKRYKEGLNIKIKLLKENNLNYKILYPEYFYNKPLNEVFSFLF